MKDDKSTWELEDSSPKTKCGKATKLLYNGTRVIARRFYCGRWDCPRCASFKRRYWKGRILREAREDGSLGYWYREINPKDYSKIYKQIQRLGANYFAIANDGHINILTTKPLSSEDNFLSSEELEQHLDYFLAKEKQPLNHHHKVRCNSNHNKQEEEKQEGWQIVTVAEDIEEVAKSFDQWGCLVSWGQYSSGKNEFFVTGLTKQAQEAIEGLFQPAPSPWDMKARSPFSILW